MNEITEAVAVGKAVVLGLVLSGLGDDRPPLPGQVWQVFRLGGDGLVTDIRGYPRREDALAAAQDGTA